MNRDSLERTGVPSQAPSQPEQLELLLTREQVAKRWQACPHTVARHQDLKPIRIGRLVRYRLSDILAVEARQP